jgi:hypothetical protein
MKVKESNVIEYKDLRDLYTMVKKMVYKTVVDLNEHPSIWMDDLVQETVLFVLQNSPVSFAKIKTFIFAEAKKLYQKKLDVVPFEDGVEYSYFSIVSNFSITARDVSRAILSIKNKKHRIIISSILYNMKKNNSLRKSIEMLIKNDRFWESFLFSNIHNRASAIQNALNRAIYKKRKRK